MTVNKLSNLFCSRVFWLFISATVVSLLFFISPSQAIFFNGEHDRSLTAIWNFGHVVLFFVLTSALLNRFPGLSIRITGFGLAIAVTIEALQLIVGRTFSLADIALDLTGIALALTWFFRSGNLFAYAFIFSLLAGILIIQKPNVSNALDELDASRRFPVLADFSRHRQFKRFELNGKRSWQNQSLLFHFLPGKKSGFDLRFFPRDWLDYKGLTLEYDYQPNYPRSSDKTGKAVCRLHDHYYEKLASKAGRGWIEDAERSDFSFLLLDGENSFTINLRDVATTDSGRIMDLSGVQSFACEFLSEVGVLSIKRIVLE